jgi:predicted phage terminase large subunit-like protein
LRGIRATLGEYNFASQYQQTPAPLEGGLVKCSWFKTYAEAELPVRFDIILQSWDTANKPTELADYSVCTTWGIKEKRIYLLHVYRKRLAYPDLKRSVREQAEVHCATVILIEDKASGTQLIQELVKEGLRIVTAVKPEGDKVMRFNAQTATIENGFVYVPQQAPWLADYIHEVTTFPSAKFDDQADSTSQALAWLNMSPPEDGLITYYRHDTARMMRAEGHSDEAIAEAVNSTPEEIRSWNTESQRRELERATHFNTPHCPGCGNPIPFDTPWRPDAGKKYHPACWSKKVYGW